MGRGEDPEEVDDPMTEHVVTRWYRPPELMLCPDGLYSYPVDMWSLGTIYAEMILRRPLFPGKNFVHQLTLIFDILGGPSKAETEHIKNSQAKKFLESQYGKPAIPLTTCIPDITADATALLGKLLVFNPSERMDAASAINIPYIKSAVPPQSLVFPTIAEPFDFGFEKITSRQALKHLVAEETVSFKRECALEQRRASANVRAAVTKITSSSSISPSSTALVDSRHQSAREISATTITKDHLSNNAKNIRTDNKKQLRCVEERQTVKSTGTYRGSVGSSLQHKQFVSVGNGYISIQFLIRFALTLSLTLFFSLSPIYRSRSSYCK
jgi:serine/threonine protein kinase